MEGVLDTLIYYYILYPVEDPINIRNSTILSTINRRATNEVQLQDTRIVPSATLPPTPAPPVAVLIIRATHKQLGDLNERGKV